jgi:hypothetical protein
MALLVANTGNAYAISFLYQDDTFHQIYSEGLNINSDDGGAEAATLKFGNDGTDATIIFDDGGTDDLTIETVGTGDILFVSPDQLSFADVADTLTFSQTSAGMGDDLLNAVGEVYESTGAIGSTIGAGETSTSLIHAINAVGTYAAAIGAGALDDIDDVYNNGGAGTYTADVDTASTGYNITSTDGDAFFVQNSGTDIASFSVNATDESIISFDATETSNFSVATDAAGEDLLLEVTGATDSSVVVNSSGTGADAVDINATAGGVTIDAADGISFDAADPSNFTIASDGAADDLTIAVTGATDSSLVLSSSGTGTDAIDINATAGDIDIDATGDNGITIDATESSNFTVATDAAGEDLTIAVTGATDSSVIVSSTGTGADAVRINASAGGFDFDGTTDSTINTSTGDLSLGAGDDMFFDDAQLTGLVQLSVADTDWDADFATDGIIDNINDIATQLGGDTISTFNFTEDNVLADNDTVYAALNKLDLRWGDLSSTANGEGASIVGIEDAGTYFTGTTVEAALQELGAVSGANAPNNEVLTFYPEYPDAVIFADGSDNKGAVVTDYDDTDNEHFYDWTSQQGTTNDINIKFRFPLPADFTDINDFTYRYRTGTVTEADNDVEVYFYNATNLTLGEPTLCASDTTNGTAGVWATGTLAEATIEAGCTGGTALGAGDIVEVDIKLFDNSGAADYADIGVLTLGYDN